MGHPQRGEQTDLGPGGASCQPILHQLGSDPALAVCLPREKHLSFLEYGSGSSPVEVERALPKVGLEQKKMGCGETKGERKEASMVAVTGGA